VYRELYGTKMFDDVMAQRVAKMSEGEKIEWFAADPSMFSRGHGMGESHADAFAREKLYLGPSNNDRVAGWALLHQELGSENLVVTANCVNLIRTLPQQQHSKNNTEDLDSKGEDHACDSLRYLLVTLKGFKSPRVAEAQETPPEPEWWGQVRRGIQKKQFMGSVTL
jgi:hypothetical protein